MYDEKRFAGGEEVPEGQEFAFSQPTTSQEGGFTF